MGNFETSYTDIGVCIFAILQAFRTPRVALPYFIFWGFVLLLMFGLKYVPRNTTFSKILALSSGCTVIAIGATLIFADDLAGNAVMFLALVAFGLCFSLLNWNDARAEPEVAQGSQAG